MRRVRPVVVSALLALLVAVGSGIAFAKTINVPGGKPTIQGAINAAVNGDVVVVAQGRYKANLDFLGKAITVRSSNPASPTVVAGTIIDGDQKSSVVVFKSGEKATSVLKGFTITNGIGALSGGNRHGGGISCWNGSCPTISDNIIKNNTVTWSGGGVYCRGSSPTLLRNTISDNVATIRGGGVSCEGGAGPALTNNIIRNNLATDYGGGFSSFGGGVYCELSNPTLTGNTISGNTVAEGYSTGFGGGMYCYGSSPTLTNNTIRGNRAVGMQSSGGGVCAGYAGDQSSPALTNNVISGNSAESGGGVYCNGSSLLTSNAISGNTAVKDGGGVYCSVSPSLSNNTINGNSALNGGGVYCAAYAEPVFRNNTISGNQATKGGGMCCDTASVPVVESTIVAFSTRGGGIFLLEDLANPSRPTISYSDVYGNVGGNYVNMAGQSGQKGNICKNPLFADAANADFHLKSKGGCWNPKTRTWVVFTVHSPCIDAGDPAAGYGREPLPNGRRRNMGAFGNTKWASKSAPKAAPGGALLLAANATATREGAQVSVNISSAASVEVRVLNVAGRELAVLPARELPMGVSTLLWNGRSSSGTQCPPGRYLVRVTARGEGGTQAEAVATLALVR